MKSYNKKDILKAFKKQKSSKKDLEKECLGLWREIVVIKAGNKCEYPFCHKDGKNYKLDAHHPYSKRIKHMKADPDNGILLCVAHHQAGWGKEAAHSDINFKDKITGVYPGFEGKGCRTVQFMQLLDRKAQSSYKPDWNAEKLYLQDLLNKLKI